MKPVPDLTAGPGRALPSKQGACADDRPLQGDGVGAVAASPASWAAGQELGRRGQVVPSGPRHPRGQMLQRLFDHLMQFDQVRVGELAQDQVAQIDCQRRERAHAGIVAVGRCARQRDFDRRAQGPPRAGPHSPSVRRTMPRACSARPPNPSTPTAGACVRMGRATAKTAAPPELSASCATAPSPSGRSIHGGHGEPAPGRRRVAPVPRPSRTGHGQGADQPCTSEPAPAEQAACHHARHDER